MIQLDPIKSGQQCPYCGQNSVLMDSAPLYGGISYGLVYACMPCKAWVGVHKGTEISLGRLANEELREAKKRAHIAFDRLWQGRDPIMKRTKAYAWLAKEMEMDPLDCHIGMMDIINCNYLIYLCEKRCPPPTVRITFDHL
jgi:hypothetical protein